MARIAFTDPRAAVRLIPDRGLLVLPQGCAEPVRFYAAFSEEADRFRSLRVVSGMQFGDYPFLARGLGDNFSYETWHVGAGVKALVGAGRAGYVPLRYADIVRHFGAADAIVVHTSVPDAKGALSLGVSVGVTRELIRNARLVIAEVSERMPFTCGESTLACEEVDVFIDGRDSAPAPWRARPAGETDARIAALAAALIPEGASLQLGLGTIPQALLASIDDPSVRIHSGMVSDPVIEFIERTGAPVLAAEVVGSTRLFDYVDRNAAVALAPSTRTHDPRALGAQARFTAVNSALEVDLSGQVNAEVADGTVVSGVGGSADFMLGASLSPGGAAIIALPSTAAGGSRSRIVPALGPQAPVSVPRHCVDYVVTELGVAHLAGRNLVERARALAGIAHPRFREALLEIAEGGGSAHAAR